MRNKLSAFASILIVLLASCSDDTPTGSGTPDTTPPGIVSITPVDQYHVDVMFNESVASDSAEFARNYEISESGMPATIAAPGDPLYVTTAVLQADNMTVSLSTYFPMAGLNLTLSVNGVSDQSGNAITIEESRFVGSSLPDETPPEIVGSTPAAGSTGAPIGTSVTFRFSEYVDDDSFSVHNITWSSPSGPVEFRTADYPYSRFTLVPINPLEYGQVQTITIPGLRDQSGNRTDATLSFTTTTVKDETAPQLVSSNPPDLATNVSETSQISLTFSEPINRYDFSVEIVPDLVWDAEIWSHDGTTVTYTLRDWIPLRSNQQYIVTVYPTGVFDLGGNTVLDYQTVIFTTGPALETGSIAGRIVGDPESGAADPVGALVIAESWETSNIDVVGVNDLYKVERLQNGPYHILAFMDSNHDGRRNIEYGDALGGFGADIGAGDYDVENVFIIGSRHATEVDFPLYDPSAVSGHVTYSGIAEGRVLIGLFASGADASILANPLATDSGWWPSVTDWVLNQLDFVGDDGGYYFAAFIDVNGNDAYDGGTEPAGIYGGFDSPAAIQMVDGQDYVDLVIPIVDPVPAAASTRIVWPSPKRNVEVRRLVESIDKALISVVDRSTTAEPGQH